jgi:uncharacterized protein YqgC (DUF456 family)
MTLLFVSLGFVLMALGFLGCVAPVLPGPVLCYAAVLCLVPTDTAPSVPVLVTGGLLTAAVTLADSLVPVLGAKLFACSRRGLWGCALGTFAGLFFFPVGLLAGPFLGAFLGELAAGKTAAAALKGGVGALLGFLAGTLLKLVLCLALAVVFAVAVFGR